MTGAGEVERERNGLRAGVGRSVLPSSNGAGLAVPEEEGEAFTFSVAPSADWRGRVGAEVGVVRVFV